MKTRIWATIVENVVQKGRNEPHFGPKMCTISKRERQLTNGTHFTHIRGGRAEGPHDKRHRTQKAKKDGALTKNSMGRKVLRHQIVRRAYSKTDSPQNAKIQRPDIGKDGGQRASSEKKQKVD